MRKMKLLIFGAALAVMGAASPGMAADEKVDEKIDEKIDWGKLMEFYLGEEMKQGRATCQERGTKQGRVIKGKGGICVELPIVELDQDRMRTFIESNRKRPSAMPPKKEAVTRPAQPWIRADVFAPPRSGDWNKGAPFAKTQPQKAPRG